MSETNPIPSTDEIPVMLEAAIQQIQFARSYTLGLVETIPHERWFETPSELPTNVAWQVGHLAYSQYGLLLFRLRGREPEDLTLVPGKFRKAYGRGTTPSPDPEKQPTPTELLEKLARVYELGLEQLSTVSTETLLEPVDMPFAGYPIKLGAVLFCPLHEHIHAGQIGLLRRSLGLEPVR